MPFGAMEIFIKKYGNSFPTGIDIRYGKVYNIVNIQN